MDDVAHFVERGKVDDVVDEIKKCRVLCAHCHIIKTWLSRDIINARRFWKNICKQGREEEVKRYLKNVGMSIREEDLVCIEEGTHPLSEDQEEGEEEDVGDISLQFQGVTLSEGEEEEIFVDSGSEESDLEYVPDERSYEEDY